MSLELSLNFVTYSTCPVKEAILVSDQSKSLIMSVVQRRDFNSPLHGCWLRKWAGMLVLNYSFLANATAVSLILVFRLP